MLGESRNPNIVPRENCLYIGVKEKGFIKMPPRPPSPPPASLPTSLLLFKSLHVLASLEIYDVFCFSNTLKSYLGDKELRGLQIACWLEKENMMYGECRLFRGSKPPPPCLGRHVRATERHSATISETTPPHNPPSHAQRHHTLTTLA